MSDQVERQDIKAYYSLINEAELLITKGKYSEALGKYIIAKSRNRMFTKDAKNALLCSIESKKFEHAVPFLENLVQKGVPISFFEKNIYYHDLILSKSWSSFISNPPSPTYDKAIRNKIDSLLIKDQEFRHDYFGNIDTIRIIDSLIKQEILDVFKIYGYVNDDLVGIKMLNDSTIKPGWNSFDIILIHQIKNNKTEFINFLENSVLSGKMENTAFESHSKNFSPLDSFRLNCMEAVQGLFIQVNDELLTCCCEEEQKINDHRKKYYLESLSELRKKVEFNYEIDNKFFLGGHVFKYNSYEGIEGLLKIKQELLDRGFIVYKKLDSEKPYFKK